MDQKLAQILDRLLEADAARFFSWRGVTWYLTPDAIFDTLRMVASTAPGSEIIFQYLPPAAPLDEEARQRLELLHNWAAARGEPFVTFFEPAELVEQVRKLASLRSRISDRKRPTPGTLPIGPTACAGAHPVTL